ncbi:hypothetical protein SHIRM173S_13340 [Streptomyces hirsutus]
MPARMWEKSAESEACSITIRYITGAALKLVNPWLLSPSSSATRAGSKRRRTLIRPPAMSVGLTIALRPAAWKSGSALR